jgi:hypothetical protein
VSSPTLQNDVEPIGAVGLGILPEGVLEGVLGGKAPGAATPPTTTSARAPMITGVAPSDDIVQDEGDIRITHVRSALD